jgi:hypothetical protein
LKIFADVVKTKKSSEDVDKKIRQALQVFEQLDLVKSIWQSIFPMLTPEHQAKLVSRAQQQ